MDVCLERCVHQKEVARVVAAAPDGETVRELAAVFKVLSDPGRLRIVVSLLRAELCVCDLSVICGRTDSAVSHQLRILRNLRIVRNRREGKIVYYRLADDHVRQLVRNSLEHIGHPDA